MTYSLPAPGARFRLRSRRLTLIVGAAAIALAGLTATTRPAKADAEDLLRFLVGAAIVAAIVNAVDDHHTPRHIDRWVLPNSCLETARVHGRSIDVYNSRCLSRGSYNHLPSHCERNFRVNGRNRSGYVAECLWESGYRREGGHNYRPGARIEPPAYTSPRDRYNDPREPRHSPPGFGHDNRLPQDCEMTYRQNGQRMNGYWGTCLEHAGIRNLPRHCRLNTRGQGAVYNRQCLRDAGYRR